MPDRVEIVLVRHGQTEWNVAGRIQGHGDSPLTALGIAQAEAIARRLTNEPLDRIISSDLGRARHTAEIIAAVRGQAIEFEPRLRERCFGVAEGSSYAQIADNHPEMFSREKETDPHFAPEGGESRQQHLDRVRSVMQALANIRNGERILVVTHGGVLSCVYRWLHGIGAAAPHPIEIPNAAYNLIRHEAGAWAVAAWGDVSHLEADAVTIRD